MEMGPQSLPHKELKADFSQNLQARTPPDKHPGCSLGNPEQRALLKLKAPFP